MSRLDPNKLSVEFRGGVTPLNPIIPRRYTLTHSDITAELFLTIGKGFAYDKINSMRDEVLGQWSVLNNRYVFYAYCYVDGASSKNASSIRYRIFQRELPLALEAIRFGDKSLFKVHPQLDLAPIWIYFRSIYPEYSGFEYWGTFKDYTI